MGAECWATQNKPTTQKSWGDLAADPERALQTRRVSPKPEIEGSKLFVGATKSQSWG
jgi:hypothetical protein